MISSTNISKADSAHPGTLLKGSRPNIVFILVDDLGYGDLHCYGCPDGETPRIDAFFSESLRFNDFYANGPLCAPTRASFLSGVYPQEAGMWRGPQKPGGKKRNRDEDGENDNDDGNPPRALREGLTLLPAFLKNAGYKTGMIGKWHLGYTSPDIPNERGFEHFMGFLPGSSPYGPDHKTLELNGEQYEEKGHLTEIFTNHAIDYITAHKDDTFFLYLAYNAPHGPIENGASMIPEIVKKYTDRGIEQRRANYLALVDHLDQNIGRVLDVLKSNGLEDNTLVVFASDNGGQLAYLARNLPCRGGKGQTFDGGIRVPCAVRWPGKVPAGKVTDVRVAIMDFFPTLLDAAGAKVPSQNGTYPVSGISLLNVMASGGKVGLPERYLFFELRGLIGVFHGDWKIVADIYGKREPAYPEAYPASTRVKKPLVFELYNIKEDISETTDLAGTHPDIVERLKKELVTWMETFEETRYTRDWKP